MGTDDEHLEFPAVEFRNVSVSFDEHRVLDDVSFQTGTRRDDVSDRHIGIDLICIGAHGAGSGMRSLFGSNVDRVLRQAPCPLLVTQPLRPAGAPVSEATPREAALTV